MSCAYAATRRPFQSASGLGMSLTCSYAPSGKKEVLARSGSSAMMALHSARMRASKRGLAAVGTSRVCGRREGSEDETGEAEDVASDAGGGEEGRRSDVG